MRRDLFFWGCFRAQGLFELLRNGLELTLELIDFSGLRAKHLVELTDGLLLEGVARFHIVDSCCECSGVHLLDVTFGFIDLTFGFGVVQRGHRSAANQLEDHVGG